MYGLGIFEPIESACIITAKMIGKNDRPDVKRSCIIIIIIIRRDRGA